mgnify:CR=1 FL=1
MAIKILLADDSLTIQKVVELTFSDAQTRLVAVGSGDRAVEALDDFQPDLVLADVVMPGLSGYDVCEAVKQRPGGAFIPVVLLTGTFEPFDRARAERVGSDAIVTKPFDSHALQGLVHELVGKARLAREAAEAEAAAAPAAAPEPPPTMILSAEELAGEFPAPAPIPVPMDTASTLVLSPLDLAEPAPPPSAEAATAVPEGESIYSTMAMPVLSGGELEASLEETPPPVELVFITELFGQGNYSAGVSLEYKLTFVDALGNESLASESFFTSTTVPNAAILMEQLQEVPSPQYVARKLYRRTSPSQPFTLVDQIPASVTQYLDRNLPTSGNLQQLRVLSTPGSITRPRLDAGLVIDPSITYEPATRPAFDTLNTWRTCARPRIRSTFSGSSIP